MSGLRKTQIMNIIGAFGCAIAGVALFSNKIQGEPTDAVTAPRDSGRSYRPEHTLVAFLQRVAKKSLEIALSSSNVVHDSLCLVKEESW